MTKNELQQAEIASSLICILKGVLIGSAVVLLLNASEKEKDVKLENKTVKYITEYIASLVDQGLTRDALGFLWSQMSIASQANELNKVQAVAHYLLGCVLEASTVETTELTEAVVH